MYAVSSHLAWRLHQSLVKLLCRAPISGVAGETMAAMRRLPAAMVAVIVSVIALGCVAGCSRTVVGSGVVASDNRLDAVLATTPLSELMLEPSAFPPEFAAAPLRAAAAQGALALADGVPPGARVTPPECQPAAPAEAAALEGVHDDITLRVMLSRGSGALAARRDQLTGCARFSVATDTGSWDVRTELLPPPVLDVDDAFALEQIQTNETAGGLSLVGEVAGVRVTAAMTGAPARELDTAVLDQVFTAAVQKLRHAA